MKKIVILLALLVLCFSTQGYSQVAAQGGFSLNLDGVNDYVSINEVCSSVTSTVSVEAWVKPSSVSGNQIIFAINESARIENIIVLGLANNSVRVWHFDGSSNVELLTSSSTISANAWSHIVLTVGSGVVTIFINGKNAGSASKSITVNSDDWCSLGQEWDESSTSEHLSGQLDEVRIWNTVRTEAQIKANMYKELTGSESGLVAYYKMNEGSGTSVDDSSPNTNTATLENGTGWSKSACFGGSGQAINFDGSNNRVSLPNTASFQPTGGAFTAEAWVKLDPTGSNDQKVIMNLTWSGGAKGYAMNIYKSGSDYFFSASIYLSGTSYWTAQSSALPTSQWIHLAMTWQQNGVIANYVNGYKVSETSTASGAYTSSGVSGNIGSGDNGTWAFFKGNIDELRIWNTARSEDQIRENMMKTLAGNESGLVAYYRMDQYDGSTLYDMTSNGNNATLINMTLPSDWVASNAFNTWIGAENNSWSNANNWTNAAPSSGQSLGFYNTTDGVNFDVNDVNNYGNIYLSSVNTLSLNENAEISILGNIFNQNEININSSASGDASLIVKGDLYGSGTYNAYRYLTPNQWHLVSSLSTAGTAGVFHGIWLRPYDESANDFGEYIVPDETPMPTGQGFSVWAPEAQTRTFSGIINHGNIGPLSVQLTGSAGANTGWNLMGNPYTSAIDWDAASGWTRTNIADAVYVWNNNQYASYVGGIGVNGGSRYVAPGQGFFVQATATGASLSMSNGVQVHNSGTFLKNTEEPANTIRISVSSNGYSDEAVIVLRESDSYAFDPQTDAYKFPGSSSAPQMFTKKNDNSELSISSLNSVYDLIDRAVYISSAQEGEHTLSWTSNIEQEDIPVLYDNLTSQYILPETSYVYNVQNNDPAERFTFKNYVMNVDEHKTLISVFESNNVLYINNPGKSLLNNVNIYNMQGQLVMQFSDNVKDLSSLSPAVYIVKVNAGEDSVVEKVIVK